MSGDVRALPTNGMPTEVARINREHIESFMELLLSKWRPATANNRYRALAQLFKWLEEEGEVSLTPMAKMSPPKVPDVPVAVVPYEELPKLLKVCEGATREQRRDSALICLLVDTGMRASELVNLRVDDIRLRPGRRRGEWARGGVLGPVHSGPAPPATSTAISGYRVHTRTPASRGCGSGPRGA